MTSKDSAPELDIETSLKGEDPEGPLSLLVSGAGGVRVVSLGDATRLVIGRGSDCDVVVDDASVSRKHAVLRVGTTITIEDLGSRNGTIVQQRRLASGEEARVGIGWVFELGSATLLLQRARELVPRPSAPAPIEEGVVVADPAMLRMYAMLDVVAPTSLSVLLLGETGVGKDVFAQAIHGRSPRARAPLLPLNCAALPASTLEGELFGYEKGAFTGATQAKPGLFEAADGGTVFLDEIGELPLAMQAKLLRVLERGEVLRLGSLEPKRVDVRFVSATNRDLRKRVAGGEFRSDLFFRVNGITFTLPPLRKRKADVLPLARHFAELAAARARKPVPEIGQPAQRALEAHRWPGNVRELRNVIERAVVLCGPGPLELGHLLLDEGDAPAEERERRASSEPPSASARPQLRDEIESLYKERVIDALRQTEGNQSRAAKLLGVSRRTLVTKMEQYGLERPRKGKA